ncbi:MAG: nucleotidyltransferase domain-containing protein [Archaeoglobus sp.]|nr:nucleotidyltransferase domain-containing protein [Archaeoglobus sp.]
MLENIPREVVDTIKKLKEGLKRKGIEIEAIYLFGSYAKGDYLETSDIDVIVVSDYWEGMPFLRRMDIVNEVLWREGIRKVEAIPLTKEEIDRKESTLLRDASRYWIELKI